MSPHGWADGSRLRLAVKVVVYADMFNCGGSMTEKIEQLWQLECFHSLL